MKAAVHMAMLTSLVFLVGGGFSLHQDAGLGLTGIVVGTVLLAFLTSFLLRESMPPLIQMDKGKQMRLAHLITILDKFMTNEQTDATARIYFRTGGGAMQPVGMVFAARLDGERALIFTEETDDQKDNTATADASGDVATGDFTV